MMSVDGAVGVLNFQTAVFEVINISGSGLGIVWRGVAWCGMVWHGVQALSQSGKLPVLTPAARNLYSPAAGMIDELF
jgi:hypothetical protein